MTVDELVDMINDLEDQLDELKNQQSDFWELYLATSNNDYRTANKNATAAIKELEPRIDQLYEQLWSIRDLGEIGNSWTITS